MRWISGDFRNLNALYVNQLRVMLSAEEQIVRELPNMAIRATDQQLQQAFTRHLEESKSISSGWNRFFSVRRGRIPRRMRPGR